MIELKNLTKTYGKKTVFADVNLAIPDGSFTILRGASGAGKTTLLNIIGGLEKVTTGDVIIDGQDVSQLKGKQRVDFYRHKVGFVFQGFYLQPQLTVGENIALAGIFAGIPKNKRMERVRELSEYLGIEEIIDSLPEKISGGQAERACVARAMFMRPKIILADEPTNNLDQNNADNVMKILQQIQETTGVTVVMSSHDQIVEKFATQIVGVRDGRVVLEKEMR